MAKVKKSDVDEILNVAGEDKTPRTVKLSTIIWVVTIIIAFGLGGYLGIAVKTTYTHNVTNEAQELIKDLKLNER